MQVTSSMVEAALGSFFKDKDMRAALEAALSVADAANATEPDVEQIWQEFWRPIVAPDGVVNLDQVKRELFDFHTLINNAAEVYVHVTGGMISKVNTLPSVVISVADDHYDSICNEYIKEERAALSVADAPAPDDAAFGDAVEQFSIAKDLQCMAAQDGFIGDSRSVNAARARVEALHADARNAGLRELRSSIEHQIVFWEGRTVADPPEHYGWVLEEIDAMLGGDGE